MSPGQPRDPLALNGLLLEGKYALEGAIGEGGAAVVYRALQVATGARVAVKFLTSIAELPEEERAGVLEDFAREGELINALSARSSAIVQARDVGVLSRPGEPPLPFLVLEWLDGRTLDEVLVAETREGKPPRSLAAAVALLEPIAGALAVAHERGVAHRDVKPENIFVLESSGPGARIKLLDFGIAKVMRKRAPGVHQTGTLATAFTPHYGAPEQFSRTFGETGTWSDVFALALVVLEVMRGGRRAMEGDYVQLAEQSCRDDRRPTPRALGLEVSDAIEAVFSRALAVRPQHRYDSAGAFWSALLGAANTRAEGFPLSGPSAAAAARRSSAPPPRPVAPAPPRPRHGGARTLVYGAAAGALLLIVAASVSAGLRVAKQRGEQPAIGATSAPVASDATSASPPPVIGPTASASAPAKADPCPAGAVLVSGGRFPVGSDELKGSGPKHNVFLDTFCLDRHEVTAKAYAECVALGVCPTIDAAGVERGEACTFGRADRLDHPVNCATFDAAATYCASRGMRLPSEAEWEVAATHGAGKLLPWKSDGPLSERANVATSGAGATTPVGSLPAGATPEGVADLVGNVAEWQSDYFAPYPAGDQVNPRGPESGKLRVVRGGWFGGCCVTRPPPSERPFDVRLREGLAPEARSVSVGFRCAKSVGR